MHANCRLQETRLDDLHTNRRFARSSRARSDRRRTFARHPGVEHFRPDAIFRMVQYRARGLRSADSGAISRIAGARIIRIWCDFTDFARSRQAWAYLAIPTLVSGSGRGSPATSWMSLPFSAGRGEDWRRLAALAAVAGVTALDLYCAQRASAEEAGTQDVERAETSLMINSSPAECYRYWRELSNFPNFVSELQSVQVTGDRTSHWMMAFTRRLRRQSSGMRKLSRTYRTGGFAGNQCPAPTPR